MSDKETDLTRQVYTDDKSLALTFKDWGENEEPPRGKGKCEIVLPFFNQLTKTEQEECLRIFDEVDENLVKYVNTTPSYRDFTNGFPYVIDNLRIILQLPHDDDRRLSDFVKFLMIASLRTMKILNKQNIELLFALREYFDNTSKFLNPDAHRLVKKDSVRKGLEGILYDNFNVSDLRIDLHKEMSALAWYLNFVFFHWQTEPEKTLRILLQEHVVYCHELIVPVVENSVRKIPRNRATTTMIKRIATEILHQYTTGLVSYSGAIALLNGYKKTDSILLRSIRGMFDVNLLDFDNYTFFNYKPDKESLLHTVRQTMVAEKDTNRFTLTVEEFFEKYPYHVNVDDSEQLSGFVQELFKTMPDLSAYIGISPNLYCFIFQLFNKNEERFLEWVSNTKHLKAQTQWLVVNSCYLEFAADFAEEGNTPFSLLLPLYEDEDAFHTIVEDQWEREQRMVQVSSNAMIRL